MMKYVKRLFLLCLLGGLLTVSALADVLPWPVNNEFFAKHENDFSGQDYQDQGYLTYSPEGAVNFYEAPGSDDVVFTLDNLEQIYPEYLYTKDGIVWGIVERFDSGFKAGWCRMDLLLPVYQSAQFLDEHSSELGGEISFSDYTGETVAFYEYPGSGVVQDSYAIQPDQSYFPEFQHSYTDKEGRLWGYISYFQGTRDCWICVSDPYNDALPFISASKTDDYVEPYLIDQLPAPTAAPTDTPETGEDSTRSSAEAGTPGHPNSARSTPLPYVVIAGVATVVIAAALGIYLLRRKQ